VRSRLAIALLLWCGTASADTVLRVGTIVPDGTSWARELKAFARQVESDTQGAVKLKFYWAGVAGDELQMAERIRRQQLDGIVSGGVLCERLAPTLQVTRVPGLFLTREEAVHVTSRLRADLDREFNAAGYIYIGASIIGPAIIFSRAPVRTFQDLKAGKYWIWDVDEASRSELKALGMQAVPLPIGEATRAYDEHRTDGFITPPTAALAFQWTTQARYYTPLPMHYVIGCIAFANRSFDALPHDAREVVRGAAARLQVRVEDMGRTMDEQLLGGLFERQGLTPVPVTPELRADFLAQTRLLRERPDAKVVSKELLSKVMSLLADFRGGDGRSH
jgi:TRAP-type C4-dicarboxylate transport system substrate-binding protein